MMFLNSLITITVHLFAGYGLNTIGTKLGLTNSYECLIMYMTAVAFKENYLYHRLANAVDIAYQAQLQQLAKQQLNGDNSEKSSQ